MVPIEKMRREILRLVKARNNSAYIDVQRISHLYSIPEKRVRQELTKMADERVIRLSGWDGKTIRAYTPSGNAEEFVVSTQSGEHLHVDLVEVAKATAA